MLLAVDVGNTNIAFGVLKGKKIAASFRMMSQTAHTSDEYGNNIIAMLRNNGINRDEIDGIIVSSVVPNIMHALVNSMVKYLGKQPYIVGPGIKTGIKIATKNPAEIGPDLVVGAVGAFEMYGGPCIVVDFGTATTYVLVTENGDFTAGVVSPGIRISAKALWQDTAKLPEIEIKKPESILAQETISSMQAGLVYGQIGQAKYIINEMKRESKLDNIKVIATGGLGRLISEECDEIDIYDPNLLIQGLRIIYEKNKKVKPKLDGFEEGE